MSMLNRQYILRVTKTQYALTYVESDAHAVGIHSEYIVYL